MEGIRKDKDMGKCDRKGTGGKTRVEVEVGMGGEGRGRGRCSEWK